jgi:phosphatidylserine/phosphatidylglycerophosphate/cardiolipin synthase-like enzyme
VKSRISPLVITIVLLASCEVKERTVQGSVEPYFSAGQGIEWIVEHEIDNAVKRIDVAVYTFTSRPLAQALVDAQERGVRVRVILDPSNASGDYSKAAYLVNNGIDVRTEKGAGLMHHKFVLIDDSVLITGSFNWTASAEAENDENILLLKGFPATCRSYSREFERIWHEGKVWSEEPEETPELVATDLRALKKHVGDEVSVQGRVIRVGYSERSKTYFLNFSEDRAGFTVVIFSSAVKKFERLGIDISSYEGERIDVMGELIDHPEYGLEIIVEEPSQVRVLD